MDTTPTSVIKKMSKIGDSPLEFDDLVVAWNTLCEQSISENADDFQFADIENAAITALSETHQDNQSGTVGKDISRMLSTFEYPAFMVDIGGRVIASNNAASSEFDLLLGNNINSLPYSLEANKQLSELLRNHLLDSGEAQSNTVLVRAYDKSSDRETTIAITASRGRETTALVFVITTRWKIHSAELLQRQFQLTDAECEILINFIDGYSSKDIAKHRNRSHATIRTQLQSILQKTGSKNQTELLRTALSVSDFSKKTEYLTDAVNHPYRRRAEILREGGRKIEVTLMGDLTGQPILTLAGPSVYTCNAGIEQALHDNGLFVASVCTPGCGKTDPVPAGHDRLDYICQDITALLDQLKIERCVLLALTNNSPLCYSLANKLPDRFYHLVQMSACVPLKFSAASDTQSPWVTGILRASTNYPAMKSVLLKGAIKAWATIGAKQFMRLQLSTNPIDSKIAFLPHNLVENEHALKTATSNGISAAVEDVALSFEDWSDAVSSCPVDITIMHGEYDQLFPIESIRAFAKQFSNQVTLLEIEGEGFTFVQSQPENTIRTLRSLVEHWVTTT